MNKEIELLSEDKIEILKQTAIEKQRVFIGSLTPKRGHTLYEFNFATKQLSKTEFKVEKQIDFESAAKGLVSQTKQVDGKEGVLYVSALNEKNAWKKVLKRILEIKSE